MTSELYNFNFIDMSKNVRRIEFDVVCSMVLNSIDNYIIMLLLLVF